MSTIQFSEPYRFKSVTFVCQFGWLVVDGRFQYRHSGAAGIAKDGVEIYFGSAEQWRRAEPVGCHGRRGTQ